MKNVDFNLMVKWMTENYEVDVAGAKGALTEWIKEEPIRNQMSPEKMKKAYKASQEVGGDLVIEETGEDEEETTERENPHFGEVVIFLQKKYNIPTREGTDWLRKYMDAHPDMWDMEELEDLTDSLPESDEEGFPTNLISVVFKPSAKGSPKGGGKIGVAVTADISKMTDPQKKAYDRLLKARVEENDKAQRKARRDLRRLGFYLSGGPKPQIGEGRKNGKTTTTAKTDSVIPIKKDSAKPKKLSVKEQILAEEEEE